MTTLAAAVLGSSGLLLQAATGTATGSYAGDVLRTVVALVAVCLIAWLSLRLLAARGGLPGLPLGADPDAPVRVLRRIPLEPRRNLYLVRAGSRVLLIGVGEGGAPRLVAELDPADLEPPEERGDA
ncbi:MAG: flagellar biosynthetic protein FliO [Myxococcales bacterium]|nr:flagellar biosynthetic protein FliO [Myxococcales bacterium]